MRKQTFLKTLTIAFCFVMLATVGVSEAIATTYYVSPTGSDSNIGSKSSPFRTIQKAANIVNPGDTVIIKDGVYTDTDGDGRLVYLTRGGTSSAWITFKAENKWGAVLDGENSTTGYGWLLDAYKNPSYIRIEGFEIKRTKYSAFWIPDQATAIHDIYIYGNHIHDIGRLVGVPTYGGIKTGPGPGSSKIIIDSNVIHHVGRLPQTPINDEDYRQDHGIYMKATDSKIINNVFYENKAGWSVMLAPNADNIDVINNTFYGANPYRDGQVIFRGDNKTMRVENNISHSARNSFIWSYLSNGGVNVYIRNNLVYGAASLISVYRDTFIYNSGDRIRRKP